MQFTSRPIGVRPTEITQLRSAEPCEDCRQEDRPPLLLHDIDHGLDFLRERNVRPDLELAFGTPLGLRTFAAALRLHLSDDVASDQAFLHGIAKQSAKTIAHTLDHCRRTRLLAFGSISELTLPIRDHRHRKLRQLADAEKRFDMKFDVRAITVDGRAFEAGFLTIRDPSVTGFADRNTCAIGCVNSGPQLRASACWRRYNVI